MNDELQLSGETQREQQEHFYRLNQFMFSVLGSLNSGVVVVDTDFQVVTWNSRAEDLWGIRADEAQGASLFGLDFGLPLEPLRAVLKKQFAEPDSTPDVLRLEAVNRRGRTIQLQVTVSRLIQDDPAGQQGALISMEVLPEPET
jgi:two-component system CheB/CheR fusion protein